MRKLLLLIPLGFLLSLFYIPLITIVKEAFSYDGGVGLGNFYELLRSPYQQHVILFSIKQALISLAFTLLLGIPAAYIFTHYSFPGKKLLQPIILIPFVLPSIIVVLGFILFYGQNGYLNRFLAHFNFNLKILYRFEAIVLAHAFYNFPIVLKIVSDAWLKLNRNYLKAAQTLGANRVQTFFKITLPSLLPAIINASFLVFIYCFMSFGVVLVLGSVKYATIEVSIYFLINNLFQMPMAMALGSIQLLFSLLFLFISGGIGRFSLKYISLLDPIPNQKYLAPLFNFKENTATKVIEKVLAISFILLLIVIISGPILVLFAFGLENNLAVGINLNALKDSVLSYNQLIGTSVLQSLLNSFYLAMLTGFTTLLLTLLLVQAQYPLKQNGKHSKPMSDFIEVLVTIPLFISPITLSLGYLKLIHINQWEINRFILLLAIHTIIALPFVYRLVSQAVKNISVNQVNAAKTLGSNNAKIFFSLIIPQLKRSLFVAFSFAFAISLGEFGAVLMINRSYVTIPVAIYRFIGARRLLNGINVSFILLVSTFVFFFLMEKFEADNNNPTHR
ncbi:MAG: iron ABC transporter permease [Candidatus Cloacimonas sp.]|nr:iron ABC transporter permease [Candidatus Cloacimonadota bacterium]